MSTDPIPQPEKSFAQLQEDLAFEIITEILGIRIEELDPGDYTRVRAAIAHYSVDLVQK